MEKTLIIIKPDGVQRQLIGRIINRFEEKGLKIVGLKLITVSKVQAQNLYSIHKKKKFYQGLLRFITSSPVVVMALEGTEVIKISRKLVGATLGADAEPGTVRGDFGAGTTYNLIHASDSAENAHRELSIFFKEKDLVKYKLNDHKWVYSPEDKIIS